MIIGAIAVVLVLTDSTIQSRHFSFSSCVGGETSPSLIFVLFGLTMIRVAFSICRSLQTRSRDSMSAEAVKANTGVPAENTRILLKTTNIQETYKQYIFIHSIRTAPVAN